MFAGVSFYWGLGGTLGLDTLGGSLERLARARDPAIVAAVWVTGFLKVVGALLALALVSAWGDRLPRLPVALLGGALPPCGPCTAVSWWPMRRWSQAE